MILYLWLFSNTCTEVEILMFLFGPMATEYDSMQTEYCLQFLAIKNLDPLLAVPQRQMSDKFITKVTAKRFHLLIFNTLSPESGSYEVQV